MCPELVLARLHLVRSSSYLPLSKRKMACNSFVCMMLHKFETMAMSAGVFIKFQEDFYLVLIVYHFIALNHVSSVTAIVHGGQFHFFKPVIYVYLCNCGTILVAPLCTPSINLQSFHISHIL